MRLAQRLLELSCSLLPWLNMIVCMGLAVGNLFFSAALRLACECTVPFYAGDSPMPSFDATVWTCAAVGWALLRHATSASSADAPGRAAAGTAPASPTKAASSDRQSGERKQNVKPRNAARATGMAMHVLD